jgi:hypothetical protein
LALAEASRPRPRAVGGCFQKGKKKGDGCDQKYTRTQLPVKWKCGEKWIGLEVSGSDAAAHVIAVSLGVIRR